MAFLVYGLFALSKEGKTPRKDKKEWNKTMFSLMQLRRFWAITSINTAKPCHSFLSLFHAKHRAAGDQWPVQLLYNSFVSPPHWKRNRAFISLILSHIFTHFPPQISYPPSTCFSIRFLPHDENFFHHLHGAALQIHLPKFFITFFP